MSRSYYQRVLCVVGLVSLIHCGYSAAQHRSYIRLTEQPFEGLPLDILAQTLISLIIVCYASQNVAGHFQLIRTDAQNRVKSWDTVGNCSSFYVFDHRAKIRAFNVEIALIRDKIEHGSGVTDIRRLQFWQDAIDAVYGEVKAPVPRQPVAVALQQLAPFPSLHPLLSQLVQYRQQTLGDRPFESVQALEQYASGTHGAVLRLTLQAMQEEPGEIELRAADAVGVALGIVTHLRATLPLAARGIVLLPSDLMTKFQLKPQQLLSPSPPSSLNSLSHHLCTRAQEHLSAARQLKAQIPSGHRSALLPALLADELLLALAKAGHNVLDPRLQTRIPHLALKLYWRNVRRVF